MRYQAALLPDLRRPLGLLGLWRKRKATRPGFVAADGRMWREQARGVAKESGSNGKAAERATAFRGVSVNAGRRKIADDTSRDRTGRWWARQDLNPRPSRYERPALTTELQAPSCRSARHHQVPRYAACWADLDIDRNPLPPLARQRISGPLAWQGAQGKLDHCGPGEVGRGTLPTPAICAHRQQCCQDRGRADRKSPARTDGDPVRRASSHRSQRLNGCEGLITCPAWTR